MADGTGETGALLQIHVPREQVLYHCLLQVGNREIPAPFPFPALPCSGISDVVKPPTARTGHRPPKYSNVTACQVPAVEHVESSDARGAVRIMAPILVEGRDQVRGRRLEGVHCVLAVW